MAWNKHIVRLFVLLFVVTLSGCAISYTLSGSSIDYSKTKTISVIDFNNVAEFVHPPLAQEFTEKLRDKYVRQTRLQLLKAGGDLHLEGEIVGYELTPMSISADTYSAETKLTVTINVRFVNKANPDEDFEKRYSGFRAFDSGRMVTEAQNEVLPLIIEDITDNIYNDTVARW